MGFAVVVAGLLGIVVFVVELWSRFSTGEPFFD